MAVHSASNVEVRVHSRLSRKRIAAGGMADVYRGESAGIEGFRKKVAIKRVLPKLSQKSRVHPHAG